MLFLQPNLQPLCLRLLTQEEIEAVIITEHVHSVAFVKNWVILMTSVWKKHGRPAAPPTSSTYTAHAFQSDPSSVQLAPISQLIPMSATEYDIFLKFQATQQSHPGNLVACVAKSPSLGPWIIDSGATDHMCGNKLLFSSLTYSDTLPTITLADGTKTTVKGIGQTTPTSSLSLNLVLYVPDSSFNLISVSQLTKILNCSVTFTPTSVCVQDQGTGRTIGVGHE